MDEEKNMGPDFLGEIGLGNLSEEQRGELVAKMTEVVLKRIFLETVEKLDEKDQEEYAKMIENKATPEQIEKFLLEKIPDYDAMVKKIVDDFKKEMGK